MFPGALVKTGLGFGPDQGQLVIAQNTRDVFLLQEPDAAIGFRPIAYGISQEITSFDVLTGDVLQDLAKGLQVAVNIGNNGQAHPYLPGQTSSISRCIDRLYRIVFSQANPVLDAFSFHTCPLSSFCVLVRFGQRQLTGCETMIPRYIL
jgi:hypothetical protein